MDNAERELNKTIKRLEGEVKRRRAAIDKALLSYAESERELAVAKDRRERFYGSEE